MIIKIMLSYIGLLSLVICYMVGGGALFVYLEIDNEKITCQSSMANYIQAKNNSVQRLVSISMNLHDIDSALAAFDSHLQNFAILVYQINIDPRSDCSTIGMPGNLPKWSLANSVFFCSTIMTTTGIFLKFFHQ